MQYNLSELLDGLDLEETNAIGNIRVPSDIDAAAADRIRHRVLKDIPKKRRLRLSRVIAIAAVVAVLAGSITAGAGVYYRQRNDFSPFLSVDHTVNLTGVSQEVNITQRSGKYTITLVKVLCDNRTIKCLFRCTSSDGRKIIIRDKDLYINDTEYFDYNRDGAGWAAGADADPEPDSNLNMVEFDGLTGIRAGDKLTVKIGGIGFETSLGGHRISHYRIIDTSFDFIACEPQEGWSLAPKQSVFASDKTEYPIEKMTLTPLGIYIDFAYDKANAERDYAYDEEVPVPPLCADINDETREFIAIRLKDGTKFSDTEEEFADALGYSYAISGEEIEGISAVFNTLINVEEVQSVTVNGCVIYEAA